MSYLISNFMFKNPCKYLMIIQVRICVVGSFKIISEPLCQISLPLWLFDMTYKSIFYMSTSLRFQILYKNVDTYRNKVVNMNAKDFAVFF